MRDRADQGPPVMDIADHLFVDQGQDEERLDIRARPLAVQISLAETERTNR